MHFLQKSTDDADDAYHHARPNEEALPAPRAFNPRSPTCRPSWGIFHHLAAAAPAPAPLCACAALRASSAAPYAASVCGDALTATPPPSTRCLIFVHCAFCAPPPAVNTSVAGVAPSSLSAEYAMPSMRAMDSKTPPARMGWAGEC